MSRFIDRAKIEKQQEWQAIIKNIPVILFPPEWEVEPVAPIGETMVAFVVKVGKAKASINLEVFDRLGNYIKPYWLVSPNESRSFTRSLNDVEGLLSGINKSFSEKPLDNQFSPD